MKFNYGILILFILNTIVQYFLNDWWLIAITSFFAVFAFNISKKTFIVGFVGIILSWLAMILFIEIPTNFIVSKTMSNLFPLYGNALLFYIITLFIGGIVGGLSAICANMVRKLIFNSKK